MPYTQDGRVCTVTTPLGKDVLLVSRFAGGEYVSRPFLFEVDFLSEQGSVDFRRIVGRAVCVHLELDNGRRREFHGIVTRFAQGTSDTRFVSYRAVMEPWFSLLTRNADCRIFQDKNAPDIVKQVFTDRGFSDYALELKGSFRQRKYCVQYRETDFNFVSRLLEEEGIAYYFRHEAERHVLVLTNSSFPVCSGQPEAEYATMSGAQRLAGEVEEWLAERDYYPGKYAVSDYNFETPSTSLEASTKTAEELGGNTRFELFDYPTEHETMDEGTQRARLRMEVEEAAASRAMGRSACPSFSAGQRFTLKGHYRNDYNGQYLLTSVQHTITQGVGYTEEGGGTYSNSFGCIPASVRFRPPFATPKPVVQGVQTAAVVGQKGEELTVDKYGRVKVQFHWDRYGKRDEKSSCWIRVAQILAGKGFGGAFWPRIGQEVVVSFLEGDPDRPLITGRVYNAEQMPPYELPPHATQSGVKSRSSKGGTAANFNQIRLEDKMGDEHLFIHAEKDRHDRVKADAFEVIGGEKHKIVKEDDYESYEMNRHLTVKADLMEDVQGSADATIGMNRQAKVGVREAVEAGQEIHLKGGMTVVVEAGMQLTLKAAGGFVTIDPSGVTIQGTLVRINSGGAAGSGSGASPQKPKPPKEAMKE